MLNYIWAMMILAGIGVGIITGRMEEIGNGALAAAGDAVTVCITMLGILSMWMGLMQVARASGLLSKMADRLQPVIRYLFPRLPAQNPATEYIATNMVANIMGLGWAATPAGVKAMEELAQFKKERRPLDTASTEMCTLLVTNMSSLQLIPINMIAYRSQYGSVAPAIIVAPVLFATLVSTVAAVAFCKVMAARDVHLKQKS